MKVEETLLNDCFLIHDTVLEDDRGFFFESFNAEKFRKETGANVVFVQDNQSRSKRHVIRGLHFQIGDFAQAKLVRVLQGEVLDVVVDLRKHSSTFGKHYSVKLSGDSRTQLFVPRGFAHGFSVLSETADFFYKCDNYYHKGSEGGLLYCDPQLNIDWNISQGHALVSAKDLELPNFDAAMTYFD